MSPDGVCAISVVQSEDETSCNVITVIISYWYIE